MPETEGAVVIGSRWLPTISARYRKARGRTRKFKSPLRHSKIPRFRAGDFVVLVSVAALGLGIA